MARNERSAGQPSPPAMSSPAVVLDTNVLVAAGFKPRSASARIVHAVREGQVRMVWNDATRQEIEHIIGKIPPLRAAADARLFRSADRLTGPTYPERFAFIPDPDDRTFAALADAAGAILISSDDHLLAHRDRMGVPVLAPAAFWRRVQRSTESNGTA